MTTVVSPSDAAYSAAARPAGPAPTMVRSYSASRGADTMPNPAATCSTVADSSRVPSGRTQRGRREASIFSTCSRSSAPGWSASTQSYGWPLRVRKSRIA